MENAYLTPYIIAETAYNHEGDVQYLYKMIDDVADIGLNAIKFHMLLDPAEYMEAGHPLFTAIQKWLFSERQWDDIIDRANKKNLDVVVLCDDVKSAEYLIKTKKKIAALELHASCLNDYHLLEIISEFDGRIILGVGGSTLDEIEYAIDFLTSRDRKDIVLMYGFQHYPTDYRDINLSKMIKLRELFELPIGYADHTAYDDPNNEVISVMGAVMGFSILEKHYTPHYGAERIDYQSAVGKAQMLKIKKLVELALAVYGKGDVKLSKPELEYGNTGPMKKAIVARSDIKKGEKISFENLCFKRTKKEGTVRQNQFLQLIGLRATKDIKKDELVDFCNTAYEFKNTNIGSFTHIKRDDV